MDTLAYIYATCAYEAPSLDVEADLPVEEETDCGSWGKLSSQVSVKVFAMLAGALVLGTAQGAIAATLERGDSSLEVKALQTTLSRLGYFQGPQTGYFGTLTETAVMQFQRDAGLNPDGVVGPQTQTAMEQKLSATGAGGISFNVTEVQRKLRDRGYYTGAIDGIFGPQTRGAVVEFQRRAGLTPDGIVGPRTSDALNRPAIGGDGDKPVASNPPAATNPEVGVAEIQRLLRNKGYYDGTIDGVYGPTTRQAVITFQRDLGLTPDGIVGSRTLQALRSNETETQGSSSQVKGRHVVVVPYRDSKTLLSVQRVVPDAFLAESRQGAFVQVGSFSDRAAADRWAKMLQSQGFDASVQ